MTICNTKHKVFKTTWKHLSIYGSCGAHFLNGWEQLVMITHQLHYHKSCNQSSMANIEGLLLLLILTQFLSIMHANVVSIHMRLQQIQFSKGILLYCEGHTIILYFPELLRDCTKNGGNAYRQIFTTFLRAMESSKTRNTCIVHI